MFVYASWDTICQELSQCKTIRADEILIQEPNSNWVVVKHDVETAVYKALILAKIEAKYKIRATYYIQADLVRDNYKILQEIQKLGHEVSYHYDVLDANSGDFDLAIKEFNENIDLFHSYGLEVKTVCPHGNPLINRKGWSSNKDFFRNREICSRFSDILDIVVELPNKVERYLYISDAGYRWKQIVNIEDNDIKNGGDIDLGDYKNLLKTIKKSKCTIISTHPHRWEKSYMKSLFNLYRFNTLRFIAKKLASIGFLRNIMSKFYFLAKKV
jgi:hypothetical protein